MPSWDRFLLHRPVVVLSSLDHGPRLSDEFSRFLCGPASHSLHALDDGVADIRTLRCGVSALGAGADSEILGLLMLRPSSSPRYPHQAAEPSWERPAGPGATAQGLGTPDALCPAWERRVLLPSGGGIFHLQQSPGTRAQSALVFPSSAVCKESGWSSRGVTGITCR